ncbi:Stf0 family sulfotransferase [Verrucomicrobiota bacterium]
MCSSQVSFVICATPRSGSSFLGQALAATGVAGKPEEWFQTSNREERKRAYGMPPDVPYDTLVKAMVDRERTPNGVFGVKIMWETLGYFPRDLTFADPANAEKADYEVLRKYIPGKLKFVFSTRRDKLNQAISYSKARQSCVWEYRGDPLQFDKSTLRFDFVDIARTIQMIERHEEEWRAFFLRAGAQVFEVVYEDLERDYSEVLRAVLAFLGIEHSCDIRESDNQMLVMRDDINEEWRKKYLDLSERVERFELSSTPKELPDSACRALISGDERSLKAVAGRHSRLEVAVRNTGRAAWPSVGSRTGKYWINLRGRWLKNASEALEAGRACLPRDVNPGEQVRLELIVLAPREAGEHELELDLVQEGVCSFKERHNPCGIVPAIVELDEETRRGDAYFADAAALSDGWKWLPWLGYYYAVTFPWIRHSRLGWLCCHGPGASEDDYWFLLASLGWLWTSEKAYPYFYSHNDSVWLYYQEDGTVPGHWFCNMSTGEWKALPAY